MASLARDCGQCKEYSRVEVKEGRPVVCPRCSKEWGKMGMIEKVFDRCPVCEARQFYIQKDFNQALGCAVMLVGIVLVPWTYGLSLPVFAAVDWILHKKVPTLVVCYQCLSEFRGFKIPEHFKPFMHHIGARYEAQKPNGSTNVFQEGRNSKTGD